MSRHVYVRSFIQDTDHSQSILIDDDNDSSARSVPGKKSNRVIKRQHNGRDVATEMRSRRNAAAREARKTGGSTMREKSCQWIITVIAGRRDWELGSWMGFALFLFMWIWE